MSTTATPLLYSTRTLCVKLNASRATLHRWRICGYLPAPVLCEGKVTVWDAETINRWLAGGCQWSNPSLARKAQRIHGTAGLRRFVRPDYEPSGPRESAKMKELLDAFEAKINDCEALLRDVPSETDVRCLVGRMTAVRRELVLLRNEKEDSDV